MDKIKEKDLDHSIRLRNLTTQDAESILSYDYEGAENLDELDIAIGDGLIAGEIKDPSELYEIINFLEIKGLMPNVSNKELLALNLANRIISGKSAWKKNLMPDLVKERLGLFSEREAIRKVIEISGGNTHEAHFLIYAIGKIDDALERGEDYNKVFETLVYRDSGLHCHAFLNHLEEKYQTTIKDYKELSTLGGLESQPQEDVKNSYYMALEHRYAMALDRILENGGSYSDLEDLNHEAFNLPESWDGISANTNKEKMIEKAILLYFNMLESHSQRPRLRDIAEEIKAPYEKILKIYREGSL